jgi:hypothetical protein
MPVEMPDILNVAPTTTSEFVQQVKIRATTESANPGAGGSGGANTRKRECWRNAVLFRVRWVKGDANADMRMNVVVNADTTGTPCR